MKRIGHAELHFLLGCTIIIHALGCKRMTFHQLEGKALTNHVIDFFESGFDESYCRIQCYLNDNCISYNFHRSQTGHTICELNESDHVIHGNDLVQRANSNYSRADNCCNCTMDRICRYNFIDNTFNCDCRKGYTLEHCTASYIVRNCRSYKDKRTTFILDATNSTWPDDGICYAVLTTSEASKHLPYQIDVQMFLVTPDGSKKGHPGLGFNVNGKEDFDVMYFRPNSLIRSVEAGYLSAGQYFSKSDIICLSPPPVNQWFNVTLKVDNTYALVYINGGYRTRFQYEYPLRQKGALLLANGNENLAYFRNYRLSTL